MNCPTPDELLALCEGELTENRAAELRAHAAGCTRCTKMIERLEQLRGMVKADVRGSRASVGGVMSRIAGGGAGRPVSRGRAVALSTAGALLVAGLAALIVRPQLRPRDEFAARGGSERTVRSHVGITLHLLGSGSPPLLTGQVLAADAPLVAGYRNLLGAGEAFLTVFGVDAAGEVHWLYPGFTQPSEDPASLPLPPSEREALLKESVVLEAPAAGPLRLYSVVTPAPLKVRELEGLPHGELTRARLRSRFPDAQVEEWVVEVKR